MSNEIKFLRLLIGETSYKDFNTLYQMLKLTARDRSVQRESVWRNESGNKQGEYLSNVAIGYGKTAILHIIDIEANVEYLKSNLKRQWDWASNYENDCSIAILKDKPLGKKNIENLKNRGLIK